MEGFLNVNDNGCWTVTRADLYETHFNDKMYSSLGFREKRLGTFLAHLSHRLNTLYNCDAVCPASIIASKDVSS